MSWPEMFIKFKAKANNCGKTDTTIELNRWNLLGFGILMISFPYIIKGTVNTNINNISFIGNILGVENNYCMIHRPTNRHSMALSDNYLFI